MAINNNAPSFTGAPNSNAKGKGLANKPVTLPAKSAAKPRPTNIIRNLASKRDNKNSEGFNLQAAARRRAMS